MGEDFDYNGAMARIGKELATEVGAIWNGFLEYRKGTPTIGTLDNRKPEDNARTILFDMSFMRDSMEMKRLSMLLELNEGRFWHGADNWKDMAPVLSQEE